MDEHLDEIKIDGTPFHAIPLSPPFPESTLRLDEICSEKMPVISWRNSEGGCAPVKYTLQVDTCEQFNSKNLIEMDDISEGIYTTAVMLNKPLADQTRWYYRIKAVDAMGAESDWSTECGGITSRFFVLSTEHSKFQYFRIPIEDVKASYGIGTENITDYDDKSISYWEGMPGYKEHWVQFDLGEEMTVNRIFLLCGSAGWKGSLPEGRAWNSEENLAGRLKSYIWQYSSDGEEWNDIGGSLRTNSNAFREIIDFSDPVSARYFRIRIQKWYGDSPRIYGVMFYAKQQPPVPEVPDRDYVLVISNIIGFKPEQGKTKTDFGWMIKGENGHIAPPWELDVIEIPAYAFSLSSFSRVKRMPVAIFLSGSPNTFCQLPMFEFNGEFELIRTSDIPIWGSCAGIQMMAMAYGNTYTRDTGRSYRTYEVKDITDKDIPAVHIQKADPIFAGMNNPFYGTELHTWMVHITPNNWDVLATSQDKNGFICTELIRDPKRLLYGSQFHPEITQPFSCSKMMIINFLQMAIEKQHQNM